MIKSLRIRLSVLLILAVSTILGVFGFYSHRQLVNELNENFAIMQTATANLIAQSAATPLWEINTDALANILRAQLASPDIVALRVQDLDGKIMSAFKRDANGDIIVTKEIYVGDGIVLKKDIFHTDNQTERIGDLAIWFTRAKLDATIERNAEGLVMQSLAIDFVLILLLLLSLRFVFGPLADLRDALMQLAGADGGDQDTITELAETGDQELDEVARGFNLTLRKIREEAKHQERVLAGKAKAGELSQRLQNVDDYAGFGKQLLLYLASWLGAEVGTFYVKDENCSQFVCVAGHGIDPAACKMFCPGEGVIGEAAMTGCNVMLRDLPDDRLRIVSGIVTAIPHTIVVIPINGNSEVIAVIELGYLHEPSYQEEVLTDALPVIAFSLKLLMSKQATLKELRERTEIEERSRLILGAVNDGIVGLDSEGRITFANPAAITMLGYSTADFIGQSMHALVHYQYPDRSDFPQENCSMYMTGRDGRSRTVDTEVLWHKDGTSIPVEYSTTPVFKDSMLVGTVVVYRDITERKEIEEKINAYFNNSSDGLMVLDPHKGFIHGNQRAVTLFGFDSLHGLLKCGLTDVSPETQPDGRLSAEAAVEEIAKAMQAEKAHHFDWMHKHAGDGRLIPCEITLVPIVLSGRSVLLVSVRDITERKETENAIKHVSFLNDQALGLTKAGHWHVPLDGSGWYNSSKRAVDIFGDIPNENYRYRIQEDWFANVEAGDPEYAKTTGQNFQDTIDGKVPAYDSIYAYKRPIDGKMVWIHAYGSVSKDANGKPTDMYGVTQDITEYVLAQQELAKAKDAAMEATKAKSEFLANMSHEIRTPMNAIIGMSHLALQTNLDNKQRNYIEKVHRAGENLLGIINDILDFSKIEAGKLSMESIDFYLEDVMDHLANLVGLKAEDKGLELLFSLAPNMPTALVGDPLRLGQILINLGNNAVKFTEQGEIIIGGEVVSRTAHEVEMHFWVQDSGIGMMPEQCDRMFQSFSQADASTTRKYGGTGLGLAISKNLVELMHGRIWVDSELGKGSTFHFHARFGLQTEPKPRLMFRADELLGVRVLVVDDNAASRVILSTMAKNFGLEVDVACDGSEALKLASDSEKKQLPYDMVLMDWKMPGMDGIETVQKIQEKQLSHTPAVIMVTAYGREEALNEAENRRVALKTVLTKPVTQSTLLEAIGEVLGKGIVGETRAVERADNTAEAMAKLKGARVLLVEDNEMNQELAGELLRQAGIEVTLADNGQRALDILQDTSDFDGVLMDCQMPVMDGYTATRELRKDSRYQKLPIIAMTANAMVGDKEKVLEAGMNDHIAKPLNVNEMFNTIAKWIIPANPTAPSQLGKAGNTPKQDTISELPGIDTLAGLATTMGNTKLYSKLLLKFRNSQANFEQQFTIAQNDPDPNAAIRAAHTLKGNAGNIGAKAIQQAAKALEFACMEKQPPSVIDELLGKTLSELQPVLDALDQLGKKETPPPAAPMADPAQVQALLQRLRIRLDDSDTEAQDIVEELLPLVKGTTQEQALQIVANAVNVFDYEAALEALENVNVL
jgi:two-component system sensor histidine kinase/response regulator